MTNPIRLAWLIIGVGAVSAFPQAPYYSSIHPLDTASDITANRGAAAVWQLLQKLHTRASLIMLTAHPDDEDGGMLTYESRGRGARVTLLTLNRGEGGANVMSPDYFDALGLVFEGYGPIGERRDRDLGGRLVDTYATFPGGGEGAGVEGLRRYLREHRQQEFLDNLSRKLIAYALGRTLLLSDDPLLDGMLSELAANGYRFSSLVETIIPSPQFQTQRDSDAFTKR